MATWMVADIWCGAFNTQPTDAPLELRLLSLFPERTWREFEAAADALEAAFRRPGPDGVPFAAWAALGERGKADDGDIETLNESAMVLLPKDAAGVENGPALGVERSPKTLRPLQLSNMDPNLLARIANRELGDPPGGFWRNQRGFVRRRVIWDSVVELDMCLRTYAMMLASSLAAVLVDQAKAFTALDQQFMVFVSARACTQRRVLRLCRRLLEQNAMSAQVPRAQSAYTRVTRGLERGCHASASVLAMCFETRCWPLGWLWGHRLGGSSIFVPKTWVSRHRLRRINACGNACFAPFGTRCVSQHQRR